VAVERFTEWWSAADSAAIVDRTVDGVEEVKVEPWDSFPLLLDQRGGRLQRGGHRHPRLQRHRLSQADVWFNFSFTVILFKFVKYV
jgi:hypothetical protein